MEAHPFVDHTEGAKVREDKKPIVIVDVGASGGIDKGWQSLPPGSAIYGFEPDEVECRRLNEETTHADGLVVTFVPLALGEVRATQPFYQTVNPYCSSNLPPIEGLAKRYPDLEGMLISSVSETTLVPLDDWCQGQNISTIDYIKLDTQGSELDILRGARQILDSTLIVETEVEFNPLYEDQPLFGEIAGHLRERGFALWDLNALHYCHIRGVDSHPVKTFTKGAEVQYPSNRPGGQLMWGQAFFVRADLLGDSTKRDVRGRRARAITIARARGIEDLARTLEHLNGTSSPLPVMAEPSPAPTQQAVKKMREDADMLRSELQQVREELRLVRTSRSFRWTRPLRTLHSQLAGRRGSAE